MTTELLQPRCLQFPESGSRTPLNLGKTIFGGLTGLSELDAP